MKSRISVSWALMAVALALTLVPAATIGVQQARALSGCDWAQFITDVSIPDGTTLAANTAFTKTWRLKNIGTCTWTTTYSLVFDSGETMSGPASVYLPTTVYPGQTVDISVGLTAPAAAGHYFGYWKFRNASGSLFGIGSSMNTSWWVEINVSGSSGGGGVYDFAANYCSASWSSMAGSLPCPGTDGDPRGFVLQVTNPQLESGTTDTGSGLITMPQNAYNGDIHGIFPAFHVQPGDRFQSIINCAYGATSCYVTFRLDYQIGSGPIYTFWSFREKYEGLYFRTNVNLSPLAGQDVKFILTVLATGSPAGDRALWSNPMIVRGGLPPFPPPPPSGTNFDFGTSSSPVASGYTRVTESTAFSSGGYGWTDTSSLSSRDRGAPDDLRRDLVQNDSSGARTFEAALTNGNYSVTVTMGDQSFAHDNMVVKANGSTVLADVDAGAGAFAVNTFSVTVSGGYLSLEFSDAGGTDPTWVVNAVTITPAFLPPSGCDRAQFIADVTVPDGTFFSPGATFIKTWRLKNVGSCTWTTSYMLVFDSGDQMGGPAAANLPHSVSPGQTVDLTLTLTAPSAGGHYRGFWKFQNASGVRFGIGASGTSSWWVDIRVTGPTPTPTSSPSASVSKFDFGTSSSPVASSYTRVTESTAFTSGGFGWTDTSSLASRDRGAPDDLRRDLVQNDTSTGRTFKVTLANGTYSVTVTMGDHSYAHDNMVVKANGTTVLPDVDTGAGAFAVNTFSATVSGGALELEFSDAGGSDPTWVVNALTTTLTSLAPTNTPTSTPTGTLTSTPTNTPTNTPTSTPTNTPTNTPTSTPTNTPAFTSARKFDFGTATSPLAAGYARVTESTLFVPSGYGWIDTSSLASVDRGAPNNRWEDMVYSSAPGSFKVALPDGTYTVTVTMGDNDVAHDQMIVKVGGVTKLGPVDTLAGQWDYNHPFSVTVSGGLLTLEFSDAGGANPSWVVNEVTITP